MIILKLATNGLDLIKLETSLVTSDNKKSVSLEVTFDDTWNGYGKSATFKSSSSDNIYEVPLADNACVVPWEVLESVGTMSVGVRGVKDDGSVVASDLVDYKIAQGAKLGDGTSEDPTLTVYEQLLSNYGSVDQKITKEIQDRANAIATEKSERMTEVDVERKRIDNIVKLPSGSTSGDAELIDIRIGVDGNTYNSAGTAVREQVRSLKEDLGDLADIYTQYLDPNTLENKKLWTGTADKSYNESWGYFNAYDSFEVNSGIYTFLDDIYVEYSYLVGSDNKFIKLATYLGITDLNWHGDISFTGSVKLYISIYRTDSSDRKCRMIRKKDIEESKVPYEKGIFLVKLSDKTSIPISQIDGAYMANYSIFEQAYIKGSELVANRITPTSRNAIAHYTAVKMTNNVISVKAKIKFYGYAFSTFIAEPNGMTKVTDVTQKSIHINISRTKYYIGYFNGYNLTNIKTGDMSGVEEGIEKTVGFDLDISTNTITVYLPSGETITDTNEVWASVTGAYAMWEHYIDVTSQEFVCNHFTKLWAKDSDGNVLCDDLKRMDGPIGISPQGYVYGQFTNLNPNGWEF